MPETPVAAPAPSAPVAAPAAPAPVSTPVTTPVSAPVPPANSETPGAPTAPATPAIATVPPVKYDPKTADTAPKSSDYPDTQEGIAQFMADNGEWLMTHPELAEIQRVEENKTPEQQVVEATKEPEQKTEAPSGQVAAATPQAIEEWTSKSAKLKEAFDADPDLKVAIMETAREAERGRPVLDIVSTVEEAQFAVEHANRLVSTQASWMLAAEDPEMIEPAWNQVADMFKERDNDGKEILENGKPKLGSDFKPFVRKAASVAMEDFSTSAQSVIQALETRLAQNYANEDARDADEKALDEAKYEKAAFDFVVNRLKLGDDASSRLPKLPPNATPEQVAFQKKLEEDAKALDERSGKSTKESRQATIKAINKEVQQAYEAGLNTYIDTQVAAMKARGEYLPDFVINDKWINPQTGKTTNLSAFGVKLYQALNDKINSNPVHRAKLLDLEVRQDKEGRKNELLRLQTLYLPKLFFAEVKRIQDGIKASSAPTIPSKTIARVEPQSQATIVPSAMNDDQIMSWARDEAKKEPGYAGMTPAQREEIAMTKYSSRKYFGT